MKSFSATKGDHIEYSFWLTFGSDGSMRFARGQPTTSRSERAMSCTASIPKSLFRTPTLTASIGITEEQAQAFSINVAAAAEALSLAVGCDVDLRITHSEDAALGDGGPASATKAGSGRSS